MPVYRNQYLGYDEEQKEEDYQRLYIVLSAFSIGVALSSLIYREIGGQIGKGVSMGSDMLGKGTSFYDDPLEDAKER